MTAMSALSPSSRTVAPCIAVVDDDDAVRAALNMLIHSFGWRSRSYASARDYLEAGEPGNCLLLDLNMPGMNGAELLEYLRQRPSPVPTLILTGERDTPLLPRALQAGARGYLLKPFQDEVLKTRIEALLADA
ncbi:MAG: response regulator [Nevskiaceae bacterium]|nr:MAG: response regulator [Nevskiaceae bacterium]